jgi:serine/threonine protein phosphatase PrpC
MKAAACRFAALSRVGGREVNEDACGYLEVDGVACCVVADGAGGHGGGDVASQVAVASVLDLFRRAPQVTVAGLQALMFSANQAVCQRQSEAPAWHDMRSTLVVLLIDSGAARVVWGHVGDSRLYRIRNGRRLARTRDHSLLQSLIDGGLLTEQQAAGRSDRNVLVASLGSVDDFVPALPQVESRLEEGDAFLLCSDGLWGGLDDSVFEATLSLAESPQAWIDLLERPLCDPPRPGADNYTALAVWYGRVEETTRILQA